MSIGKRDCQRSFLRSGAVSTFIVPPCRSTMPKEMESPKPVPSPDWLCRVKRIEDSVKMFGRNAAAGISDGNYNRFFDNLRNDSNFAAFAADSLRGIDQ